MTISRVVVVIPARNEVDLVGDCLRSIREASRRVPVTLVADTCTDATADVAREFDGVSVLNIDAACVGEARRRGVAAALSAIDTPLDRVWIANTDADSTVPANWLSIHVALADGGSDVVVGTVRPRASDLSPDAMQAWRATHDDGQAIGHVHGANLGVRASAYLAGGGFAAVPEHEDNDLVHRIHSAGFTISATDQCEVVTSGRRVGRTPGGYARHLRDGLLAGATDLTGPRV